jgi:hypothetical protein
VQCQRVLFRATERLRKPLRVSHANFLALLKSVGSLVLPADSIHAGQIAMIDSQSDSDLGGTREQIVIINPTNHQLVTSYWASEFGSTVTFSSEWFVGQLSLSSIDEREIFLSVATNSAEMRWEFLNLWGLPAN